MKQRIFLFILFTFQLMLLSYATSDLTTQLQDFCEFMYNIVGEVAIIMILMSSIVFTLGQMFGAETRARANVWATNMVTGAIIGILIITIMPWFLANILDLTYNGGCNFTIV